MILKIARYYERRCLEVTQQVVQRIAFRCLPSFKKEVTGTSRFIVAVLDSEVGLMTLVC